jgi:regulatory protein
MSVIAVELLAMPTITKISEQKRRENRRNVYLDGMFAFGCNLNVVAKFRLREGLTLSEEEVLAIQRGEVKQECFDAAMRFLESRLHSTAEMRRKLMRREWGETAIDETLADLTRLGYLNDDTFAKAKALSAAERKHHGQRRAMMELMKAGVKSDVARRALGEVYSTVDSTAVARELAMKQAPRLRKLDPLVARRRLVGMLQRRGFDYDAIRPLLDEVLGKSDD